LYSDEKVLIAGGERRIKGRRGGEEEARVKA